jgi:hypothetical protein
VIKIKVTRRSNGGYLLYLLIIAGNSAQPKGFDFTYYPSMIEWSASWRLWIGTYKNKKGEPSDLAFSIQSENEF